jgi:drug/metabolite transporter superfamily protein YnfA
MKGDSGQIISFLYAHGIDITAILALIASLLALALVQNWGQKIPRWFLLVPAGVGGLSFIYISLVTFYKLIVGDISFSNTSTFSPWVLLPVYGGFFTWGVTICLAALSYGIRTRKRTRPLKRGMLKQKSHIVASDGISCDVPNTEAIEWKPSSLGWWRRWPEWARYAAIVWTLIYGALGLYWSFGGSGFPLGLVNDPITQNSFFKHVTATEAGPVISMFCFLGVIVLFKCNFKARGFIRTMLLFYTWSAATILCLAIPDARALIVVAYAPIYLIVSLFWTLPVHYFDHITWPVVNQFICIAGGLLWAATALSFQRLSRGACHYCGRKSDSSHWMASDSAARWARWITYVAILAPAYYDITRIAWLLGIPLGISKELFQSLQDTGAVWAGAGLALVSIGGTILTRGLIKSWGEVFPRWIPLWAGKRVPPALAIVPAGLVSIMLTITGIEVVLGFSIRNLQNWGASTPLLLFLIWGIALGVATIFYYYRRQGRCNRCGL